MTQRTVEIKEFPLDNIRLSASWVIIGPPQSGKGTFVENLLYYNKHRYPVMRSFTNSETQYNKLKAISHPLFVSNYYDEKEEMSVIIRQKRYGLDTKVCSNPYCVNFIDDVGNNKKFFHSKEVKGCVKIGTQHWKEAFIIANQYAIDFPPDIREAVSYIVLFRAPNPKTRKKLYENFGGIVGTYEDFCDLMDQITGDYTCMIIDNLSQSNNVEDCVFWYRVSPIEKKWKFGCKEFQDWGKERYNPKYIEKVVV